MGTFSDNDKNGVSSLDDGDYTENQVECRCSELSKEIKTVNNGGHDKPFKLKALFEEIVRMQQFVEKCKLFKSGQELYSEWLEQVRKCGNMCLNYSKEPDNNDKESNPSNDLQNVISRAYNNRGYLKYLQVDFEGAIHDYTKALKYDSTSACAYYNRGLVTYRLAFFQQSIQDMKTALQLDPCEEFRLGLQRAEEAYNTSTGHSFNLECNSECDD
ncbi:unnamed protein product [Orchesella dallaii]|uniref:Tetratricopeptide repeat protein 32 n=1 Tax=Orchesella dallaii TaxID=48710 RepID=A0ABP1QFY4_9HEXA